MSTGVCSIFDYDIPTGVDTTSYTGKRNKHGQVLSVDGALATASYQSLVAKSETCRAEVDADPPDTTEERHEEYRACIADEINAQISYGLELVFGENISPGKWGPLEFLLNKL